jgi:hypothetical protein
MDWNFHTELRIGPPAAPVWRWSCVRHGRTVSGSETFAAFYECEADARKHGLTAGDGTIISFNQPDRESSFPKPPPPAYFARSMN